MGFFYSFNVKLFIWQFCPAGSSKLYFFISLYGDSVCLLKVPMANFHDCGHSHCAVRRTKWDPERGSALCKGPIANSHYCGPNTSNSGPSTWVAKCFLFCFNDFSCGTPGVLKISHKCLRHWKRVRARMTSTVRTLEA